MSENIEIVSNKASNAATMHPIFYELDSQLSDWQYANQMNIQKNITAEKLLLTAEKTIREVPLNLQDETIWKNFLNVTRKPEYLLSLSGIDERYRWAEVCFAAIQSIKYSFHDLFIDRVLENPDRILFKDMSNPKDFVWTYSQVKRICEEYAASFYKLREEPRLAIISDNSPESAFCDIAALAFDILVSPLNIHFDVETLKYIISTLKINLIAANTLERINLLLNLKRDKNLDFTIIAIDDNIDCNDDSVVFLNSYSKKFDSVQIKGILDNRKRFEVNEVATVMFTSGTTGLPKGVSFSNYNIVCKRFARGAALPKVGSNEVLLCYLPLFHTFGRYFEMLGMIYWGGTYVFAGNTSAETLLSLFPVINPTGFVSVPVRWVQLYEKCFSDMVGVHADNIKQVLISNLGNQLSWGISAAGFLDPKVFKFFEKNCIDICSGFGMTEASGGITMTVPGEYHENSNGRALPGIYLKLNEQNELEMRGHYVAPYVQNAMPGELIPYPISAETDSWVKTGDIFRQNEFGEYSIVDRVKDIYKNNKGQTIAPLKVEQHFNAVPGIKRVFLVGDGKPYNVLFIIPDKEECFLSSSGENCGEYFHKIIVAANQELAPFERIVNFAVLQSDFSIETGELTEKGSYNRKKIEKDFDYIINELYKGTFIEHTYKTLKIKIPRWFFRDLGILESDIIVNELGLFNIAYNIQLYIKKLSNSNHVVIGDFEYEIDNDYIDLGLFAHQPKLWIANPNLIEFAPCKEGWDLPLNSVKSNIYRPWNIRKRYSHDDLPELNGIKDQFLLKLNTLLSIACFSDDADCLHAVHDIDELLKNSGLRYTEIIRKRLEALSRHPQEDVRCTAYMILLLDDPQQEYENSFPAFLDTGLNFLNKGSIQKISLSKLEKRRFESLRVRLHQYRNILSWPVNDDTRRQFINIFDLLVDFVANNPEFYGSVRGELANWLMHKKDKELSSQALYYFKVLSDEYENRLLSESKNYIYNEWESKFYFEDNIPDIDLVKIKKILYNPTFLKQSIILAFDEKSFELDDIDSQGGWVSLIRTSRHNLIYRVSINTKNNKHFDLQLVIGEDLNNPKYLDTVYRLIAVAAYPFGPRVLPKLGACRPELGARMMVYIDDLTFWDKIRQLSSESNAGVQFSRPGELKKMFIEAFAAFFRAWRNSGKEIVPGMISPTNITLPTLDFKSGAIILSLTGWHDYDNSLSIIKPIIHSFYERTAVHYPWTKYHLKLNWIFDSILEALAEDEVEPFYDEISEDLNKYGDIVCFGESLKDNLIKYRSNLQDTYYIPLALYNASDRYNDWLELNPDATPLAKEQMINELYKMYNLNKYPAFLRFTLFKFTYFKYNSQKTLGLFDSLTDKMAKNYQKPATQFIELSDLQDSLESQEDRVVLSHLIFPRSDKAKRFDLMKLGEKDQKHLVVKSYIYDKNSQVYEFREPIEPSEIGMLYRLFFRENMPKIISEQDKYFIVFDNGGKIAAGLCYKNIDNEVVLLDAIAVDKQYKTLGLGKALIDDFANRMASQGIKIIKTHFILENFYKKMGFKVDRSWGALIKVLDENYKVKDS